MQEIIVFGTGNYFVHKRKELFQKYRVIAFLDNRLERGTKEVYEDTDIAVLHPESVHSLEESPIFLMSVYFVQMWKQLMTLGVDPDRIVFPFFLEPCFDNEEALNHVLKEIRFSGDHFTCIAHDGAQSEINTVEAWREFLRDCYRRTYPLIEAVAQMGHKPVSRQFGTERGTPVDRYYIEKFLEEHKQLVKGEVLEIEDNTYSLKYGEERLTRSIVMDVGSDEEGVTFNGNLETGEGIRDEVADCFILTQTLMYLFDLKSAAHNISRLLKKRGAALITCSGISQNSRRCMDDYGCCFNFNADALRKMFESEPDLDVVETGSYGNVKTVMAHLGGLCREDLEVRDFEANDKYYPLIVYVVVKKK